MRTFVVFKEVLPIHVGIMAWLLSAFTCAQVGYGSINVRDFGAVGDGVHDDTLALQKAADAVRPDGKWVTGRDVGTLRTRFIMRSNHGPAAEVYFPKGVYRITGPVVFTRPMTLRGEKGTVIRNDTKDQDSFYMQYMRYTRVENLAFEGGRTQLRIWTIDSGGPQVVQNCTFKGASKLGFSYRTYAWKDKPVNHEMSHEESDCAPCIVTRRADGRCDVTERDPALMKHNYSSALLLIERCRFVDNAKAFDICSDGEIVRDCIINAPRWAAGPAATVQSKTLLQRVKVYVERNPGLEQYAFEVRKLITTFQDCEIRSDGDLTAILMTGRSCMSSIITRLAIRNLRLDTGSAPLVRFPTGCFPNLLSVRGVTTVRDPERKKRLFDFETEPKEGDFDTWYSEVIKIAVAVMPKLPPERTYGIVIDGIDGRVFDPTLPKLLAPFVRVPSADAYEPDAECFAQIDPSAWGTAYSDPSIGSAFQAKASAADDEKMHALFERAMSVSGGGPCTVEIPPLWIKVRTPIELRGKVRVVARGMAVVTGDDAAPIFTIAKGADVVFENLVFQGGKHVVQADVPEGHVRFFFCWMFDQAESSIRSVSPTPSATRIEMSGCEGQMHDFYRGNANPMLLDGSSVNPGVDHEKGVEKTTYCPIINLAGGRLELHSVLSSPMCFEFVWPFSDMWKNHRPEYVGDYRWIDNYGKFRSFDMRFGGEWGGLTAVYQYGRDASTYIEGGFAQQACPRLRFGHAYVVSDTPDPKVKCAEVCGFNYGRSPTFRGRLTDGTEYPLKSFLCYPFSEVTTKGTNR